MEHLLALVTCLQLGEQPRASPEVLTWPGVPGLVALSRTIVRGAALGRAVRWVMYGALVAGLNSWHTCVVNVPSPLAFGQSTSWRPTGQGLLLATVGSRDGHGVHPILRLCAQWTEIQANATAGRLVSLKNIQNT